MTVYCQKMQLILQQQHDSLLHENTTHYACIHCHSIMQGDKQQMNLFQTSQKKQRTNNCDTPPV